MSMKKNFLIFSIISYVISLILPVFVNFPYDSTRYESFGFEYVAFGWMAIESPLDFVTWLCNFSLVLSWIANKKKIGEYCAYISAVFMLFYGLDYVFKLNFYNVTEYHKTPIGYIFWLLAGLLNAYYFYDKNKRVVD